MGTTRKRLATIAAVIALTTTGVIATTSGSATLALPGATESTTVTVEPTRVLDTRIDVGLSGNLVARTPRKLTVTGAIPTSDEANGTTPIKTVIPTGATGAILNVTSFNPTSSGFISIRPGDATGLPSTSNLNVSPGQIVPNSVTVAIPTSGPNAGQIDIAYGDNPGSTTGIIIDLVGYTTNTGLIDLSNRLIALEAAVDTGTAGIPGPAGPKGDDGDPGTPGADGADGADGDDLYSRTFVAHDDASLVTAVNSASSLWPGPSAKALIYLEPGTFTTVPAIPGYVDLRGSGDASIITDSVTLSNADVSDVRFSASGAPEFLSLSGTATVRNVTVDGPFDIRTSDAAADITINDSHIDSQAGIAVSLASAANLVVNGSFISADPDGTGSSGSAVSVAASTTIRDSELRGGNAAVTGFSNGDEVEIINSTVIGTDNTIAISFGSRTATVTIRDSYIETAGPTQIQGAPGGTIFIYNSTLAGSTGGVVAVTTETCVGVAEIDLDDGSADFWHDTTCP